MSQASSVVDTVEDYSKMKVVELKKLLKDRGLAVAGTKDELIERLRQANEAAEKKLLEETAEEIESSEAAATIDEELENEIMNDENKVTSTNLAKAGGKIKLNQNGQTVTAAAKKGGTEENKENAKDVKQDSTESDEPAKKIIKLSTITPEEQRKLRAAKFGLTEEEKKEARAKRFGIVPEVKTDSAKAGITTGKNLLTKVKDDALMKKRAERFGLMGTQKLTPEEEEKRKKRAERFGINQETVEVKK